MQVLRFSSYDLGSGAHVHLSLWKNGKNVFMSSNRSSKYGISHVGKEFITWSSTSFSFKFGNHSTTP
ncbi:hypothetical protein Fmac_021311 [Flemingia macrophylla]|uniref:GS catalytic domain-containing protein n=1 Tax=Flemingia macrophylla TaxID=520843 RepID=A0ABD1LWJ7_9FABA